VTIGRGVTRIWFLAFANCEELKDVYCYAEKVPSAQYSSTMNIFNGSNVEYATLHVPDSSIDSYKATEPWSTFGTIVGLNSTTRMAETQALPLLIQSAGGMLTITGAEAGTPVSVYDTTGQQLATATASGTTTTFTLPTSSLVIVRIGEKSVKVAVR
jgi:hypothetical protein